MILTPSNGSIINTNSVYSQSPVALNDLVVLNAPIELGGSDNKIDLKPSGAFVYSISPPVGLTANQVPYCAKSLITLPKNGSVLRGFTTYPVPRFTGQPIGLLLSLTYS